MKRAAGFGLLVLGIWFALAQVVYAHESRPVFLGLDQQSDEIWRVTWKRPMLGDAVMALSPVLPSVCFAAGQVLTMEQDNARIEIWNVNCPAGLDGAALGVASLGGARTDVLVRVAHADGQVQIARLSPATSSVLVAANTGTLSVAMTFAMLGIKHIGLGFDHLLFVLLLVLIAGRLRRIFWAVTGFTLAHSATLALATLDVIRVPVSLVEALIALSIAALAAEIAINNRNSLAWRAPALISSAFGLLHGLGFASALRETGIPQNEVPLSLLFFNVGVELGQLAFVMALLTAFMIWRMLRSSQGPAGLVVPQPSAALTFGLVYPIGAISGFWTIERTLSFI